MFDVKKSLNLELIVCGSSRLFSRRELRQAGNFILGYLILFNGCRIATECVLKSNMSDYSSMATLQNNSQPAGFAAALQRAKLVRLTA